MDFYEPHNRSSSATIDIDVDDWGDTEEIELESEEHDLFLQKDYVKSTNKDIPSFKATSPTSHANGINGRLSRNRSHSQVPKANDNNDAIEQSNIELFEMENTKDDLITAPPVVYQVPNYQQYAGDLAPSSPTSVLVSFIIIVVILFVTIVPIILPQSPTTIDKYQEDDVIKSNGYFATSQIEHADARCKCICPPLPQTHKNEKEKKSNPMPTGRRLYVGNTSPNQCNCNNIVQPHLIDNKFLIKEFCSRCECRYQSRNTTTIRRNVVFFIVILIGLGFYMFVQYILKYFRITRRNLPRQLRWLSHQLMDSD